MQKKALLDISMKGEWSAQKTRALLFSNGFSTSSSSIRPTWQGCVQLLEGRVDRSGQKFFSLKPVTSSVITRMALSSTVTITYRFE